MVGRLTVAVHTACLLRKRKDTSRVMQIGHTLSQGALLFVYNTHEKKPAVLYTLSIYESARDERRAALCVCVF